MRSIVSKNCQKAQLHHEIKELSKEDRESLVDSIKCIEIAVSAKDSLAMKADLGIPWNKLRNMRLEIQDTIHYSY